MSLPLLVAGKDVPNRHQKTTHPLQGIEILSDEIVPWQGECRVRLANGRYFVVVGALLEGRYAVFDTDTSELVPCEA